MTKSLEQEIWKWIKRACLVDIGISDSRLIFMWNLSSIALMMRDWKTVAMRELPKYSTTGFSFWEFRLRICLNSSSMRSFIEFTEGLTFKAFISLDNVNDLLRSDGSLGMERPVCFLGVIIVDSLWKYFLFFYSIEVLFSARSFSLFSCAN